MSSIKNKLVNLDSKKKRIFILVLVVLVILLVGTSVFNYFGASGVDARRFAKEHGGVSNSNIFRYVSLDEALDIMNKESGIIYFGYSDCEWCKAYVKTLNKTAKSSGFRKIYYCDIKNDMEKKTDNYKKLIKELHNLLPIDNYGNEYMAVPYVLFVKDGKITNYDDETSSVHGDITPSKYWTEFEVKELKTRLKDFMKEIK